MATAQRILDIARTELGYKENPPNSNITKYGEWYGLNGYAWCMIFAQWVFAQAGAADLLPKRTASCSDLMNAAKKAGLWVTKDFQPGDVLIYTFGHTGICEAVSKTHVTAIEGNTGLLNNANGGKVMRRSRKLSLVKGAVRPKYDMGKPISLIAQQVLDGQWGNGDERRRKLTAAGYDPDKVQKIANALFAGKYRVKVTADVLNVRAGPGTSYKKLDSFGRGMTVTVREVKEGPGAEAWGRSDDGWIALDYVEEVQG